MGDLPRGHAARCASGPDADGQACPKSFDAAEGMPCKEVGFSCTYDGAMCPDRPIPLINYCQCKRAPTDGTMTLLCMEAQCSAFE
jgi:hypothetical protein